MGGSRMPTSHDGIDRLCTRCTWTARPSINGPCGCSKTSSRRAGAGPPEARGHRLVRPASGQPANHRGLRRPPGYRSREGFINVDRYGNTSGGSVPLALDEAYQAGRIKPGDKVLTERLRRRSELGYGRVKCSFGFGGRCPSMPYFSIGGFQLFAGRIPSEKPENHVADGSLALPDDASCAHRVLHALDRLTPGLRLDGDGGPANCCLKACCRTLNDGVGWKSPLPVELF